MSKYKNYENLGKSEKLAIAEALKNLGCWNIIENPEALERWYTDSTVTINGCRNGRDAAYILTDNGKESAVYVDLLQELTPEEIKKEML